MDTSRRDIFSARVGFAAPNRLGQLAMERQAALEGAWVISRGGHL